MFFKSRKNINRYNPRISFVGRNKQFSYYKAKWAPVIFFNNRLISAHAISGLKQLIGGAGLILFGSHF